jgi:hypothetical protein
MSSIKQAPIENEWQALVGPIWGLLTEERREGVSLAVEAAHAEPADGSSLSRRELDMCDWGLVYGLTLGFSLAAYPDADPKTLTAVSLDVARSIYRRWIGDIAPRPQLSSLVDEVILAADHSGSRLHDAAMALEAAFGAPANGGSPHHRRERITSR